MFCQCVERNSCAWCRSARRFFVCIAFVLRWKTASFSPILMRVLFDFVIKLQTGFPVNYVDILCRLHSYVQENNIVSHQNTINLMNVVYLFTCAVAPFARCVSVLVKPPCFWTSWWPEKCECKRLLVCLCNRRVGWFGLTWFSKV